MPAFNWLESKLLLNKTHLARGRFSVSKDPDADALSGSPAALEPNLRLAGNAKHLRMFRGFNGIRR
jgi:hypothetical protein